MGVSGHLYDDTYIPLNCVLQELAENRAFIFERHCVLCKGLKLATQVFESFTVANLPYGPCVGNLCQRFTSLPTCRKCTH